MQRNNQKNILETLNSNVQRRKNQKETQWKEKFKYDQVAEQIKVFEITTFGFRNTN